MHMSRKEIKKMETLYDSIYLEMDSSSVLGDASLQDEVSIENKDTYATGNTVIPTLLGVSRRNKIKSLFDPAKAQKTKKRKKKVRKSIDK